MVDYRLLLYVPTATAVILCVVIVLAVQWRRIRVAAYNARLKQLMIERGMSADEIERVLRAGGEPTRGTRSARRDALDAACFGPACCSGDSDARGSSAERELTGR